MAFRDLVEYGAVGKTNKEAPILEFSTWYIKSWHETKSFTAFFVTENAVI